MWGGLLIVLQTYPGTSGTGRSGTQTQEHITYTVSTDHCKLSVRTTREKGKISQGNLLSTTTITTTTARKVPSSPPSTIRVCISLSSKQGSVSLKPTSTLYSIVLLEIEKQDLTLSGMIYSSPTPSSLFQPLEPWMGSLPPSSSVLISIDFGKPVRAEILRTNYNIPHHQGKPEVVGVFQDLPFTLLHTESLPLGSHMFPSPHLFHSLCPFASLTISLSLYLGPCLSACFCPSTLLNTHPDPKPCLCFLSWFLQTFPAMSTHIHYQLFFRSLRESPPGTVSWTRKDTVQMMQVGPSHRPPPISQSHHSHYKNNPLILLWLSECTYFTLY